MGGQAHTEAIQRSKILKYRDACNGLSWNSVLDTWLEREGSGRGAELLHVAQHRRRDLTQSTHDSAAGESKLPTFWKQALRALQKLPLVPTDPAHFSLEGARAIPYCG